MVVLTTGRIRVVPEDFVVEELPLYEPSGTGDHLYVRFRKRNRNTLDVVRDLARLWGVPNRDVGVAGMKDRVAVTEQTISVPAKVKREVALATTLDEVTILSAELHNNKLRTGHLRGNRFNVVVRDIPTSAHEAIEETLARIAKEGIPNHFGEQRFGHGAKNPERAKRWLKGDGNERGPRDVREKKLLVSSLQSLVFNGVLDARIADGTWNKVLAGDVARKEDSGGLFLCTDEAEAQIRCERGEISPTGPMFGPKMMQAEGAPLAIETLELERLLGADFPFDRAADYGEGTRRSFRIFATEIQSQWEGDISGESPRLRLQFVLPKGAFATTLLGTFLDLGHRNDDETTT